MVELKKISMAAIPKAIEKADRYRIINDSHQAESICMDILAQDPGNQKALIILVLAITDQFDDDESATYKKAKGYAAKIASDYERHYYFGVIAERMARSVLRKHVPRAKFIAYEWTHEALHFYEKAENLDHPEGEDEAILRWNTCQRLIESEGLQKDPEDDEPQLLE
jgi:hypothetical protein